LGGTGNLGYPTVYRPFNDYDDGGVDSPAAQVERSNSAEENHFTGRRLVSVY